MVCGSSVLGLLHEYVDDESGDGIGFAFVMVGVVGKGHGFIGLYVVRSIAT